MADECTRLFCTTLDSGVWSETRRASTCTVLRSRHSSYTVRKRQKVESTHSCTWASTYHIAYHTPLQSPQSPLVSSLLQFCTTSRAGALTGFTTCTKNVPHARCMTFDAQECEGKTNIGHAKTENKWEMSDERWELNKSASVNYNYYLLRLSNLVSHKLLLHFYNIMHTL
jgi:hypothetical protein